MITDSQWALLAEGSQPIADFSAIVSLSFSVDSKVVNAPIEEGSFTSYNKVISPDTVSFGAILAGGEREQERVLNRLRELKNSTELLSLISPFESFENLNLVTVKWERTTELGSTRTLVDLTLQEVKQVAVVTERMSRPAQCKNAGSVSNVKTGRVAVDDIKPFTEQRINKTYPKVYEIGSDR